MNKKIITYDDLMARTMYVENVHIVNTLSSTEYVVHEHPYCLALDGTKYYFKTTHMIAPFVEKHLGYCVNQLNRKY